MMVADVEVVPVTEAEVSASSARRAMSPARNGIAVLGPQPP
jgi:hypothetical protein